MVKLSTRYCSLVIVFAQKESLNMADNEKKRLNIAIDAELHRQLKMTAAENGTTIVELVSDSIREKLEKLKKSE